MFCPLLHTTGVSSGSWDRSSDERNSFVLAFERSCSFSSLRVARPLHIALCLMYSLQVASIINSNSRKHSIQHSLLLKLKWTLIPHNISKWNMFETSTMFELKRNVLYPFDYKSTYISSTKQAHSK